MTGKGYNTIVFREQNCDGCELCVDACARVHAGTTMPAHSRIQITLDEEGHLGLGLCRQCAEPQCVANCPAGALEKNLETGVIAWDPTKCVGCQLCTLACPYGGIVCNTVTNDIMKCDFCSGDPACVKACPRKALELRKGGELFNAWGELEDLVVPGISSCLGCNSELLLRHTLRRVGSNVVVATPPGCIAGVGAVGVNGVTGLKTPVFHPLLTNPAAMLAGARRYYKRIGRDVTMLAFGGDGGTADVGFQSLSGAAERGEQMVYICVDNEGYMNTGGQRSGTTPYGAWTTTTPVGSVLRGKTRDAKPLPILMVMHNCEYVATASLAFMEDYYMKLDKALEAAKLGMAYIHVFSPCPTGWRFDSSMLIEVARKAVETNMVPLWEYEYQRGSIVFTYPVDHPLPVQAYLSLMGKYRHLDEKQIAYIQRQSERRIEILKNFTRELKAAGVHDAA